MSPEYVLPMSSENLVTYVLERFRGSDSKLTRLRLNSKGRKVCQRRPRPQSQSSVGSP
jgi:hypothetical protein